MTTQNPSASNGQSAAPSFSPSTFSSRDLIAIGFRHQRAVIITFCAILLGALLAAVLQPAKYQASTEFLLERSRMDPVVSPGQDNTSGAIRSEVTEEELNSEVELIQSDDVLRQVVLATGLQKRSRFLNFLGMGDNEQEKIEKAVGRLRKELTIETVRKSNLISVGYSSSDPRQAAHVLQALDEAYLQKNLAVHHPAGEFEFFDQEAENYKKNLADAETQLKVFSEQEGGVSPQLARDITLQKLNEFAANLQQTYADIATTDKRIEALQKQSGTTPQRMTTQLHSTDDAQVLQGLKSTLMNLELKRTELLTKYQPTYPLVQEVDKQLAETHDSIAAEESKPLREETTDRNPTYAWINEELAKAQADEAGLKARAAATQAIIAKYQVSAHDLEQKGIVQQDLLRKVKTEEENYLLYQHKREEARMTDALDRTRILNVAIAEQPTVPALPSNSRSSVLLLGVLLATCVSLGTAFILEYANPSFRTPSEVFSELSIPVLASVPHEFAPFPGVGNGNGNGNGNGSKNGNGNGNHNGNGNGEGIHQSIFVTRDTTVD
jgi:uncharacterized protein involved in exopolysaccharide biosynthesis